MALSSLSLTFGEEWLQVGGRNGDDISEALKNLTVNGIRSCDDLLKVTKKDLTDIYGLSEAKADTIWEAAEKIWVARANGSADKKMQLQFPLDCKAYELRSKIGFGSRGAIVYSAYCKPIKSMVAVKMYNRGANSREAEALSPYLLTTSSSFMVDWVVMPLMKYGSLKTILYSSYPHGLPERYVSYFLHQILKVMLRLGWQQIPHGPITLANCLVDSNGGVMFTHGHASVQAQKSSSHEFGLLGLELMHGNSRSPKPVSNEFVDMVAMCKHSSVSPTDLLNHRFFQNYLEIEAMTDFFSGLPELEVMAMECSRVTRNHLKTMNTIGRKCQMQEFLGKRKRMEVLETSIKLASAPKAQIDHWKMELKSCKRKFKNLKREIVERRPIKE